MNKRTVKNTLLLLMFSGMALITLNACNTVAGAGKDIQKAGQVIERGAEKN